jgi:hypothetical protein
VNAETKNDEYPCQQIIRGTEVSDEEQTANAILRRLKHFLFWEPEENPLGVASLFMKTT